MAQPLGLENPPREIRQPAAARRRIVSNRAYAVGLLVATGVVYGWIMRDRLGLDPGKGLGYWLGIAGLTLMVLLLGYSLRKRSGSAIPGSVGTWFRIHMVFGLVGPLLILYHSGFRWRALNSGVALWAMILVVLSGLIGRYLHVHLYSRKSLRHREAAEIIEEMRRQRDRLDRDGALGQAVEERLAEFHELASRQRQRLWRAAAASFRLWAGIALSRGELVGEATHEVDRHLMELGAPQAERLVAADAVRSHVKGYLDALVDAGTFSTFERLFALWHLAHIPLYIFLGLAATIHVLAVHYY